MLNLMFTGYLGRDAEVRNAGGTPVTSFSVATTRREKQRDEWVEVTTWVQVSVWGDRTARFAEHLTKGSCVEVRGEGYLRTFTDREGVERTSLECRADEVRFVGGRPEAADNPAPRQAARPSGRLDPKDDIPF